MEVPSGQGGTDAKVTPKGPHAIIPSVFLASKECKFVHGRISVKT